MNWINESWYAKVKVQRPIDLSSCSLCISMIQTICLLKAGSSGLL